MASEPTTEDLQSVLSRLDAVIRELEALRRSLTTPPNDNLNLTEELFGVLGKGSWDEYDRNLDWQRFSQ